MLHTFRRTVFRAGPGLPDTGRVSPPCAAGQPCYPGTAGFLGMGAAKTKYENEKRDENRVGSIGSFKRRLSQEQIGLSRENEVIYFSLRRTH